MPDTQQSTQTRSRVLYRVLVYAGYPPCDPQESMSTHVICAVPSNEAAKEHGE